MPVSADIYSQIQPVQPVNPLASLAQAYQVQGLQANLAREQRAEQQQNALLGLVGSPEFQSLSVADKASRLQGVGAFQQAGQLVTANAAANKDQRAADASAFDMKVKQLDAMSNLAGSVTDQASYDRARNIAQTQLGMDTSSWSPQYNPAGVQQFAQATLSAKDRLLASQKAADQAITTRGQDLTAATSIANNRNTVDATDRATQQRAASAQAALDNKMQPKPLTGAELKMQQEGVDAIGTASSINADLRAIKTQIDEGKLNFGPISNTLNSARNAMGMSSEESRNFASFRANMEKLRNDSLRLNKGVQTDGDAQRAWNELFANINDTKLVRQRLEEIERLNERAVQLRQLDIDNVRANRNLEPLDTSKYRNQPATLNNGNAPDRSALEAELRRRGLLK